MIENQRPFEIAIAIPTHDGDSRPDCAKLIENAFRANISEMPDLIGAFGNLLYLFRQTIVRVRQHENAQHLFRFFLLCHVPAKIRLRKTLTAWELFSVLSCAGFSHSKSLHG